MSLVMDIRVTFNTGHPPVVLIGVGLNYDPTLDKLAIAAVGGPYYYTGSQIKAIACNFEPGFESVEVSKDV